jgi:hypothetical protein
LASLSESFALPSVIHVEWKHFFRDALCQQSREYDMPAVSSEEASAHYILVGYHWMDKTIVSVNNFALPLAKRGWRDRDFNRESRYPICS